MIELALSILAFGFLCFVGLEVMGLLMLAARENKKILIERERQAHLANSATSVEYR